MYTVCAIATDTAGNTSDPECTLLPIYDRDGGFVTGGGWILSPAGALNGNSPEGKATFGFVSKYKPGAALPTGNTEFNFQAGDFRVSSSTYDWLVVAGARAQYKGSGTATLNGVKIENLGFILTAVDGTLPGAGKPDGLRIKICTKSPEGGQAGVIYDNLAGKSDSIDVDPQADEGGSIIIHRP